MEKTHHQGFMVAWIVWSFGHFAGWSTLERSYWKLFKISNLIYFFARSVCSPPLTLILSLPYFFMPTLKHSLRESAYMIDTYHRHSWEDHLHINIINMIVLSNLLLRPSSICANQPQYKTMSQWCHQRETGHMVLFLVHWMMNFPSMQRNISSSLNI